MLTMVQQSALKKIFLDTKDFRPPYLRRSGLGGEEFSYQLALTMDGWGSAKVRLTVDSPLKDDITLFRVGNVPCELPAYPYNEDTLLRVREQVNEKIRELMIPGKKG